MVIAKKQTDGRLFAHEFLVFVSLDHDEKRVCLSRLRLVTRDDLNVRQCSFLAGSVLAGLATSCQLVALYLQWPRRLLGAISQAFENERLCMAANGPVIERDELANTRKR